MKNDCVAPLIQPIHGFQQLAKLRIVRGERREPFAYQFTFPPCFISNLRKPITKESRSNVMRLRVRKRIIRKQRKRATVIVQKLPDKMQRPRILRGRSHRCEPDLPVDSRLIRRDEWRGTIRITWLGLERVLLPFCVASNPRVVCAFKNNFVAFAAYCAECAVSV